MMQTAMERKPKAALVGVLALLFSQAALSAGPDAPRAPEVIRVTAPRVETVAPQSRIEVDVAALIEAVNRQIARKLAEDLDAIGVQRIEFAISEVPSRG